MNPILIVISVFALPSVIANESSHLFDEISSRFIRAPNGDFLKTVNQMSTVARVLSGISLEIEFLEDSIPSDKVLAELINVPDVKLSELEIFNGSAVNEFISSVSHFSGDKLLIEDRVKRMSKWARKYEKDVKNSQQTDEYLTKVEQFKNVPIEMDFLEKLLKDQNEAIKAVRDITGLKVVTSMNDTEVGDYWTKISNCKRTLSQFKDVYAQKIFRLMENLQSLKPLIDPNSQLDDKQQSFIMVVNEFLQKIPTEVTEEEKSSLTQRIETSTEISSKYTSAVDDLKVMSNIVNSRRFRGFEKEYTSGLLNGYSDLEKLSNDVQNPLILSVLKKFTVKRMKELLKPLEKLTEKGKIVDEKWNPLNDESVENSLETAVQLNFSSIQTIGDTLNSTIDKINECIKAKPSSSSNTILVKTNSFLTKSKKMFGTLSLLVPIASKFSKVDLEAKFNQFEHLENITNVNSDITLGIQHVPNITQSLATTNISIEVLEFLKSLKSSAEVFNSNSKPFEMNYMSEIANGKETLKTFFESADTKQFITFLDKLKETLGDMEKLELSFEVKERIEQMQTDGKFIRDLQLAINTVLDSIESVKDLRAIPSIIENSKSETKELMVYKGLENHTKTFGEMARLLENVKKVLENKDKLIQVITDGLTVSGEIEKVTDEEVRNELKLKWGNFQNDKREVENILMDLETRRDKVNMLIVNEFKHFGNVFKEFENMKSADLKVKERLKVIEQLITLSSSNPSNLLPLKTSFQQLSPIDMNFASYSSSTSQFPNALSSILNILSAVNKDMPNVELSTKNSGVMANNKNEEEDEHNWNWLYIGGPILIAFIGLIIWCVWKRKYLKTLFDEKVWKKQNIDEKKKTSEKEKKPVIPVASSSQSKSIEKASTVSDPIPKTPEKKNVEKSKESKNKSEVSAVGTLRTPASTAPPPPLQIAATQSASQPSAPPAVPTPPPPHAAPSAGPSDYNPFVDTEVTDMVPPGAVLMIPSYRSSSTRLDQIDPLRHVSEEDVVPQNKYLAHPNE